MRFILLSSVIFSFSSFLMHVHMVMSFYLSTALSYIPKF